MSVLVRYASLRRLQVVLGLGLMGLVFAPGAAGAAQLDTVTATGSPPGFLNLNISAQSGILGQNASGTVSFGVPVQGPRGTFVAPFAGPVTCLSVIGPDQGAGVPGSPTIAVLNFRDTTGPASGFLLTLGIVDNGGNGADVFSFLPIGTPVRAPTDCSPLVGASAETLTSGRATVFDAPVLPTSKDQCRKGGWQNFSQFKNQGDCVSFVATKGKNQPG